MGRKKKKQIKPWCWYCNREFDDEKILIQHQKSKHFKCSFCHKKLYTGPGLSIHSIQVHKEKIDKIPYALPNRCNVDLEIYGMEGIPDEDIKEHERNKSGREDEVDEKRIKVEVTPTLPPFPLHNMSMAPTLPFMSRMSLPLMPPLQFGLAPPIFVSRPTVPGILPSTIAQMTHMMMPPLPPPNHSIPTAMFNSNDHIDMSNSSSIPPPPPPPPPITPSSSVSTSIAIPHNSIIISQAPTFPAYSGSKEKPKEILKVTKPTSSAVNMKVVLVHPEDDLPLEQIRLRLVKYSTFLIDSVSKRMSDDLSWTKSGQPLLPLPRNDCALIPPPPPPGYSYILPQMTNSQTDRRK